MEPQQMLGVLLNLTEQQSQTTEKLLAELKGQIHALQLATRETRQAAEFVEQSAAAVEQAATNAAPSLQNATREAVCSAMTDSFVDASKMAVAAFKDAFKPMLSTLTSLASTIGSAKTQLHGATASFGWKWALIASTTLASTLAVFMLSAWLAVAWQRHQVTLLGEQKAELQSDITQLQAQADMLEKKGGRITLSHCGPDNRLCIQITPNQGKAPGQTNFKGSWESHDREWGFVIPQGY
jgi:hypothetical protein